MRKTTERIKYQNCPLCNSEIISEFREIRDHSVSKETFHLYSCGECGFIFTQDPPLPDHAGSYYKSEEYISHSDTRKGLVNTLYHYVRNVMLNRKYRLIKNLTAERELLDMGCGTGYFPGYMKNKGFRVTGIEKDDDAREYGKEKFSLNILPENSLFDSSIKSRYGIITLWHVLEHLYDPKKYMRVFHDLLKENGYLIIALPNPDSYDAKHYDKDWAAYDVPRHLWHFTPRTFGDLASISDFEIIRQSSLPFDPFYNSILSEKYRHNKLGLITGGWTGLSALIKGWLDKQKATSVVYILKKSGLS